MKQSMKLLIAAAAIAIGFAAPAEAYPYHGYHGGGGVSFGFYSGPGYYPAYGYPAYPTYPYPTYYYPDPYAAPPPVYAPPPQAFPPPPMPPQASNEYCREYHSNVLINGHYQPTYGTACQQPDGTWKLVN